LTTAVNVGLVIALLLVTTLHGFGMHEGTVADVGLGLLTVAASLLVSWPKGEPSS
jgi:ABC-type transporter Mla maintaining outer membrane lipid asymmetry permease subunit MlaE